ncbi:hypothetical protein Wcon_01366 [Wolbachia endosymbiont of Cylisticus convexus]|nr:hypothetical protein Wcon_01366 [Wolbachia endosymbiont of Cylisticus convexus]
MVLVRIRVHLKCSIFVEIAQLDSSVKHWNDTIRFNLILSELVAVLNKKCGLITILPLCDVKVVY